MTLADLPVGTTSTVASLCGDPFLRERLAELGFTPGVAVHVLRRAPLGDPMQVTVRSGSFAVRKDEADCVELGSERPA